MKLYKPKNHQFSLTLNISQCKKVKCETVIKTLTAKCIMLYSMILFIYHAISGLE